MHPLVSAAGPSLRTVGTTPVAPRRAAGASVGLLDRLSGGATQPMTTAATDRPGPAPGSPVYAVLDVETTGLSPRTNRLVEVAVLDVDAYGRVLGEFATLLNPGRDVGPTNIHRIRAADVVDAPTFADVAPHLLSRLAGRMVVGHNVAFDWRFLLAEYGRLGVTLPVAPTLCTMRLADEHLDYLSARTLVGCCHAAGVRLDDHHFALADARATAGLLAHYRASGRSGAHWWSSHQHQAEAVRWPGLTVTSGITGVTRSHVETARATEVPFLAKLVASLPAQSNGDPNTDTYLAVLDAALEDRRVSDVEAQQLRELTEDLGLAGPTVAAAHTAYLAALAATAWADGVVTDAERADLRDVAHLLGMDDGAVDDALARARTASVAPLPVRSDGALFVGQAVVFTGDMDTPREELERLAVNAGLRVTSSVSGKTALLVVADAESQSGKARRAAEIGTRVVGEQVFLRLVADVRPAGDNPAAARPPRPRRPVDAGLLSVPAQRPAEAGAAALVERRVMLIGLSEVDTRRLTALISDAGGQVAAYVKDSLLCVVAPEGARGNAKVVKAVSFGVPVLDVPAFGELFAGSDLSTDAAHGDVVTQLASAAAATSSGAAGASPNPTAAGGPDAVPEPTAPAANLPPAGWYADPWAAAPLRWWDGHEWTSHSHGS